MEYSIYKLDFQTGVHFGNGMLNESDDTFHADQLFSAMYIEALKMGNAEEFYDAVKNGNLLFSDAFPYKDKQFMVPKPMLYVEPLKQGESRQKKALKKLKFLPVEKLEIFLAGKLELAEEEVKGFGHSWQQTMASVRKEDETLPYRVGTCYFEKGCGLYVIVAGRDTAAMELAETLLESLSYSGIGGKKSGGLGKFVLRPAGMPEVLLEHLQKKSGKNMLLSTALPKDTELENALSDASYLMEKRSGFVASETYAEEWRRKKDLYVFAAGSCFKNIFDGDIYDVSDGGQHPVYRYARALFMGV